MSPLAPRHPCGNRQCNALLPPGQTYCKAHTLARERERGTSRARGYTYRWHQRAKRFLEHHPLCGQRPGAQTPVMSQCFESGRVTAAYQVDHVVPHRGDQALFWDEEGNWQALCRDCGNKKSLSGL
jgi:5-methylcytosine-specific restriction protein A